MNFIIILVQHSKPFNVSTPISDSLLEDKDYRGCLVSINNKSTMNDIIKLDMVYFNCYYLHGLYS